LFFYDIFSPKKSYDYHFYAILLPMQFLHPKRFKYDTISRLIFSTPFITTQSTFEIWNGTMQYKKSKSTSYDFWIIYNNALVF
jgi:hypothetical protein